MAFRQTRVRIMKGWNSIPGNHHFEGFSVVDQKWELFDCSSYNRKFNSLAVIVKVALNDLSRVCLGNFVYSGAMDAE